MFELSFEGYREKSLLFCRIQRKAFYQLGWEWNERQDTN